tara:strand:+ start:309 stop:737 length:429 start_codon:yes stop_codon:yes gene_type:complete
MGLFSTNKKPEINNPEDMSPLEAVTHLFAAIQIADQESSYEEKEAWIDAIGQLFPDHDLERSENFFSEAHLTLSNQNQINRKKYIVSVLNRIKSLLNSDQLKKIGPLIAGIVEADGIVMTSEMEIVHLSEEILGLKINVKDD